MKRDELALPILIAAQGVLTAAKPQVVRLDDFLDVDFRLVFRLAGREVFREVDFRADEVRPLVLVLFPRVLVLFFRPLVFLELFPLDRRLLEVDCPEDFRRRATAPAPTAPAAAPAATSPAGAAARLATRAVPLMTF